MEDRLEQFHTLIRIHSRPGAMLNKITSEAYLDIAERYYEEADASENEARRRYVRHWADRMAVHAL